MYQPPIFREERIEVMHELMISHPLATLITLQQNELSADHLPMVLLNDVGPFGTLRGHVAKANPIWRKSQEGYEVLAVFQGPQAYVTPSWYPSKLDHGRVVPTWNYAVVHARGTLSFHPETSWLLEHVVGLTNQHESQRAVPWEVADAPAEYIDRQLKGIVGFELRLSRLDGKWKTSQNKNDHDRAGVINGLQQEGSEEADAIAELVKDRS